MSAAYVACPRRGVGCHVIIGANGATPTATRAASRIAAAGFLRGAAATAFPPPLPACGVADEAGDRERQAWPVAAMQPALVASTGAHDTWESPFLGTTRAGRRRQTPPPVPPLHACPVLRPLLQRHRVPLRESWQPPSAEGEELLGRHVTLYCRSRLSVSFRPHLHLPVERRARRNGHIATSRVRCD